MTRGLVFGKFYPFHKGHQAMIDFAQSQVDELIVLVCCSDLEKIDAEVRTSWISQTYTDKSHILVQAFSYKESELPNTSVSSRSVSKIWSDAFRQVLPSIDILFSSEPYGAYVAEYLDCQHKAFDFDRHQHPISATKIRTNLFQAWNWLPSSVQQDFQTKVVILGTESTGKSTLCEKLAQHFVGGLVPEAGRDIIPDSNQFSKEDLRLIAKTHAQSIHKASSGNQHHPIIFIDTDIYITQSYAHFAFGHYLDFPKEWYDWNTADLRFYLSADVPFVQDGTRMLEESRNRLDVSHRKTLTHFNIAYDTISGDWEERLSMMIQRIDKYGQSLL